MPQKKWVKDYLTFNRRDRIGALVVLAVLAASIFLPQLFSKPSSLAGFRQDSVLLAAIDTLQSRQSFKKDYKQTDADGYSPRYQQTQYKSFTPGELFDFDPNTASFADWQRLGLNERTSRTILKYTSKGGKFYKPEDLQRIWGMPDGFYDRVKDYVKIVSVSRNYPAYDNKPFVREDRKPSVVNVNEADTSAFIALPGIGGKLSARIVAFRDKLGGFYSVDQVGETYGLPDSTFQKLKSRFQIGGDVRKINVNAATKDELKTHPYIRWNLANAIVEYRNQHGPFRNLEELRNIVLIDEAVFQKISHYLSL